MSSNVPSAAHVAERPSNDNGTHVAVGNGRGKENGGKSNGNGTSLTSTKVLRQFLDRNADFAARADPATLASAAQGQSPSVFWLGCCDSRVPEAVVIGAAMGEVFVHRNIANVFNPNDTSATAALAYAVKHLHVSHVVVVGHEHCGGCAAALQSASSHSTTPADTSDIGDQAIARWIAPIRSLAVAQIRAQATSENQDSLSQLVQSNVCVQVSNIATSEIIQKAWAAGHPVQVHGWVYDLASGRVKDLEVTEAPSSLVQTADQH